jgi:pyruvate dehydrogenase phosphatase regulatory subunit
MVLEKLSPSSLDSKNFPFFTIRHMDIGMAPDILTFNVTHVGEQGYVFYIPNQFALHVFEALVESGEEFSMRQCGYYAMRALRIEKFYAFWGQVRKENFVVVVHDG